MSDPVASTMFSVAVSGIAVVASAIMQYLTLRVTRTNTLSTLNVGVVQATIAALQNALAEHLTTISELARCEDVCRRNNQPLTEELHQLSIKEDQLYNLILLHLNPNEPTHVELRHAVDEIREYAAPGYVWWNKRSEVVIKANAAFSYDRTGALFGR
ncbi:hypothetical protein IAG25_31255 [Caballeronia sp. EK]|uniref:hypothetical protein n=1 Tax=Caballeronia sp. EK TaxID=2767469 RepID=UPI0016563A0B|nr:hypothetical protein [Caballeronia sp. EK]MBC8641300.1 hypothetical protein [Caballeronia sp. EK]